MMMDDKFTKKITQITLATKTYNCYNDEGGEKFIITKIILLDNKNQLRMCIGP